jgi:hypothetical protein
VGFSPLPGRGGRAGLPAAAATADGAGAAPTWAYGARPLPRGVWTHLAVVWSAQGVAFHMDGNLVSLQGSATGVPPLGLGPLPRPSLVLGPLEGGLADLQLYFAPLTDLYPLYAGCSCGAAAPSSPPPPPAPGPAAPPWPPAPPTPDARRPLLGALHGWLPLAGSVLSWTPGAGGQLPDWGATGGAPAAVTQAAAPASPWLTFQGGAWNRPAGAVLDIPGVALQEGGLPSALVISLQPAATSPAQQALAWFVLWSWASPSFPANLQATTDLSQVLISVAGVQAVLPCSLSQVRGRALPPPAPNGGLPSCAKALSLVRSSPLAHQWLR